MQIIIDKKISEKIEALQYEVESRKDIIIQIMSMGINMPKETFNEYHKEYRDLFVSYNLAKQEMVDMYNVPKDKSWNLDFSTSELTIED